MKIKNVISKLHNSYGCKRISSRRISTSYISLFLVVLLITTTTVSWFTITDSAKVNSEPFTMESSSGLRVNDGEDLKNHIRLDKMVLAEASSVDGRNVFFPAEGNFSDETSKMKFREGNVGDKNILYTHKDFTLKGDSGVTYVYIKSYSIKVNRIENGKTVQEVFDGSTKITYNENGVPISQENHAECPIRMSFISDSSKEPIVLDPSALVTKYVKNYDAVYTTDENGTAYTKQSNGYSFSDFYYGTGKPLFTLMGTTPISASMVVWLEGTSDVVDQYANQSISVDIELESNWTEMDYVIFVDDTLGDDGTTQNGHWINSDNSCIIIMTYKDVDASTSEKAVMKSVVMKQSAGTTTEWTAPIPKNVKTDISFYRYSLTDETIFNSWHTRVGVNDALSENSTALGWAKEYVSDSGLQEYRTASGTDDGKLEHVYTARRGNGYGYVSSTDSELQKKRLSPCVGYWGTPPKQQTATTVAPTEATQASTSQDATIATEPPSGETVTISLIKLETIKEWVLQNISVGYTLNMQLNDGTLIPMTKAESETNIYQITNLTIEKGKAIKAFVLTKDGEDPKPLALETIEMITNNHNIIFQMQNNDTIKRTS